MENKIIESTITTKCGLFQGTPISYKMRDGLLIILSKIEKNTLKITLVFDKTRYTELEAQEIGRDIVKKIALKMAMIHKINFSWRYSISSRWKKNNQKTQVTTSLIVCSRIVKAIELNKMISPEISEKNVLAFEFFNNSLKCKEEKRDKEVAFWLYLAIETLKFKFENKCKFEEEIVENKVMSREKINALDFSIGKYYRHYKAIGKGKVIKIEECVDLVKEIICFFENKTAGNTK